MYLATLRCNYPLQPIKLLTLTPYHIVMQSPYPGLANCYHDHSSSIIIIVYILFICTETSCSYFLLPSSLLLTLSTANLAIVVLTMIKTVKECKQALGKDLHHIMFIFPRSLNSVHLDFPAIPWWFVSCSSTFIPHAEFHPGILFYIYLLCMSFPFNASSL
jgi:hypothetical protein